MLLSNILRFKMRNFLSIYILIFISLRHYRLVLVEKYILGRHSNNTGLNCSIIKILFIHIINK